MRSAPLEPFIAPSWTAFTQTRFLSAKLSGTPNMSMNLLKTTKFFRQLSTRMVLNATLTLASSAKLNTKTTWSFVSGKRHSLRKTITESLTTQSVAERVKNFFTLQEVARLLPLVNREQEPQLEHLHARYQISPHQPSSRLQASQRKSSLQVETHRNSRLKFQS